MACEFMAIMSVDDNEEDEEMARGFTSSSWLTMVKLSLEQLGLEFRSLNNAS